MVIEHNVGNDKILIIITNDVGGEFSLYYISVPLLQYNIMYILCTS